MTSGIKIDVSLVNVEPVRKLLERLSGPQARGAYAAAINDAAFHVRREMQAEFARTFDRATPYILKSPRVKMATADKLVASIEPSYMGGKGVDPQSILQAQEFGGMRRDKRSEAALRRAGILPTGYQTAIPRVPYPGSDDGRGNLRGPFLVQIISYLQAFGEQGYKANMTARRKKGVQRGTKTQVGRRYFVSYGRLRGQHLAPGIWAASGTHGVDVRPVIMFVRAGTYTARLGMDRIAKAAGVQEYLDKRVRFRIRQAAGI
jgi:hypothetical protein